MSITKQKLPFTQFTEKEKKEQVDGIPRKKIRTAVIPDQEKILIDNTIYKINSHNNKISLIYILKIVDNNKNQFQ